MQIEILQGDPAVAVFQDTQFTARWQAMADACRHNCVVQEPPFVAAFYRVYAPQYQPLLVTGKDAEGTLIGVLPLALHKASGQVTHAGEAQAEYHGWVALPEGEQEFMVQAFMALKRTFPALQKWTWNWMPFGASIEWTRDPRLKEAGIHLIVPSTETLIWDLTQPEKLEKMWKSKSNKNKIKRFQKRGNYRMERITDPVLTRKLMEDLISVQVDFRKEAVNNALPFGNDPLKAAFIAALMEKPESFHFTVLWLDDIPLASHFGPCDEEEVWLGLTAFDPSESKNSPGTLQLMELGKWMVEEGIKYFDLTPGATYKERFANDRRTLHGLEVYFTSSAYQKGRIKSALTQAVKKWVFGRLKVDPYRFRQRKSDLVAWVNWMKQASMSQRIQWAMRLFSSRQQIHIYEWDPEAFHQAPEDPGGIELQAYADLMYYNDSAPFPNRKYLLSEALNKFGQGEIVGTKVSEGRLWAMGWVAKNKGDFPLDGKGWTVELPKGCAVFQTFYFHPETPRSLSGPLLTRMAEAARSEGMDRFFVCVPEAYTAHLPESGLRPTHTCIEKRRMGKTTHEIFLYPGPGSEGARPEAQEDGLQAKDQPSKSRIDERVSPAEAPSPK